MSLEATFSAAPRGQACDSLNGNPNPKAPNAASPGTPKPVA
jgi:hypothetical protein